ncbi:MAG: hypothetical protein U0263_25060 [Polyangiaceae bacterium]
MAAKKPAKKKSPKRERKELRFLPVKTQSSLYTGLGGMAGALALGAGVYGQWIREPGYPWAQYLVAGGALALGAALWFSDESGDAVRVGDAGVALEKGSELVRVAWCDLRRIGISARKLVLETEAQTFEIPLSGHGPAAARILKEAVERVPEAVDVKPRDSDALPAPKDDDGEQVPVENLQIAGRHCAASDKPIAFERDARLCPTCAQVYHRDHVPRKCVTCDDEIASSAYAV